MQKARCCRKLRQLLTTFNFIVFFTYFTFHLSFAVLVHYKSLNIFSPRIRLSYLQIKHHEFYFTRLKNTKKSIKKYRTVTVIVYLSRNFLLYYSWQIFLRTISFSLTITHEIFKYFIFHLLMRCFTSQSKNLF